MDTLYQSAFPNVKSRDRFVTVSDIIIIIIIQICEIINFP
jgi:hypothetical protein